MPLHHIIRDTRRELYCGPTAICAVTGEPASKVLSIIDGMRGEDAYDSRGGLKGVRGMWPREVEDALYALGYPSVMVDFGHDCRQTFARYLEEARTESYREHARIVNVPGHFLAVGPYGGDVCDTQTKQAVDAKDAPRRRSRVRREIIVFGKRRS